MRGLESRRTGRQVVVGDGNLGSGDGEVVVSGVRTADTVADHAPMRALADRIFVGGDGDGLRGVPVGAGEGQRG
ncbi:MAG: hypothetical protein Q8Q50_00345 [Methylobacter sp.]|nr:hypothetical protein [Methylobacter sp.]